MAKRALGSRWDRRQQASLPNLNTSPGDDSDPAESARLRVKQALAVIDWHLNNLPREQAMQVLLAAVRHQKARQIDQQIA